MTNLRDMLKTLKGSGGNQGGDYWRPKNSGKYPFRVYRYMNDSGEQELYSEAWVHWVDGKPIQCSGDTCDACHAVASLEAAGDADSTAKARDMRVQRRMTFVVVLIGEPTGFKLYEATEAVGRKILLQAAKAGGYLGKWPRDEEMDEFFACLVKGIPTICGPAGKDIVLTYDKLAKPTDVYTVDMNPFECKTLTFAEDAQVPNPKEVRARIDRARAAKAKNA